MMLLLLLAALQPPELCAVCHKETVQDYVEHPHFKKGLSCAACHGESAAHRTSQGHTEPDRVARPHEIPALCGGCHPGKGPVPIIKQYSESKHGRLVLEQSKVRTAHCGTCHGVHSVRAGRATENQCKKCHAPAPVGYDPHTLMKR
jgi:hypothetical protein